MSVKEECIMSDYEIVKFIDNEFEIDVRTDRENDTVWLSQEQIAKLFGKARSTITEHINNIFKDKELEAPDFEESVWNNYQTISKTTVKDVEHYCQNRLHQKFIFCF